MNTCSYDEELAVLHAGKSYCKDHLSIHDTPLIISCIAPMKSLLQSTIDNFFMWAFGTKTPKFSDLPKLYDKVERGPWLPKAKKFKKPQDQYLLEAFIKWGKEEGDEVSKV
jgi:hypothetical protein